VIPGFGISAGITLTMLGLIVMLPLAALVLRAGAAKKALVRAWRPCGYLYQIPRSLLGRI